jgi:hypothetical protein
MAKLLATSVIRGSRQGDSHGGAYLIDFDAKRADQVLDWNTPDIEWEGRGWDRGLRGIAFGADEIFIAASDELFVYDKAFTRTASFRNRYLKHCHEIALRNGMLFLTSTGFDGLLGFDIVRRAFTWGLTMEANEGQLAARQFDPNGPDGPQPSNALHLNSVAVNEQGLFFSGLRTPGLFRFAKERIGIVATLPEGTHTAQPFRNGIIFNDTNANAVRFVTPAKQRTFDVPRYAPETLTHMDLDDSRIARQAFGRGLCPVGDGVIAAGSSPATVALHDVDANKTIQMVTLSSDMRTSIHGLAVWPFD